MQFTAYSEKAVQLVLDVGQLGVYGGRESLRTRRQDLFFIEAAIGADQFLTRRGPFVAEVRIVPGVIFNAIVVAAEFREDDRAAPAILFVMVRVEIDVITLKVTRPLVVPSAGVVDRPRRVVFANPRRDSRRDKLSPTLVEQHPYRDGNDTYEMAEHRFEILLILPAAFGIFSREKPIVTVFHRMIDKQRIRNEELVVLAAAVDHVLPDEHAEPVAVIIPPERLDLDVLEKICGVNRNKDQLGRTFALT